ncbi:MAG: molecular chaperone TorD family protein [Bacillota bacterium]
MTNQKIGVTKESARIMLYQLLTLVFYEPTIDLLATLDKEENLTQLIRASGVYLGSQSEKLMRDLLAVIPSVDKESFINLKAEYTRLFIGPMTPICPPYESVFDQSRPDEWKGTMAGPTSDAMAAFLRGEGLDLTLEYAELPDHVAIELEFMYYLLSRAYSGEENSAGYLEKANAFLTEHLAKWLPEFGRLLSQKAREPFYQKVGLLLEAVIIADLDFIS